MSMQFTSICGKKQHFKSTYTTLFAITIYCGFAFFENNSQRVRFVV
jgi:hypothetical protein